MFYDDEHPFFHDTVLHNTEQIKSSQVKSSQVKSSQIKSSQIKSSQVKSSQVKQLFILKEPHWAVKQNLIPQAENLSNMKENQTSWGGTS